MNLLEKSKILVFYLASFFIINQAHSQCDTNIVQQADCIANGIIEIVPDPTWIAPFSYELNYPNGNQATGTFSTTSFQIDSLQGDNVNDYELIMSSGVQTCTLNISLTEYTFNPSLFTPNTNGYAISCNGLCDGEIQTTPLLSPFQTQTVELFLDSAVGTPLFSESLLNPPPPFQTFSFDNLCAGDYVVRYTSQTGCEREFTRTIYESDSIDITGSVTDVLCSSELIGAIDVGVSGGVGTVINSTNGDSITTIPYTYSWSGPGAFTSPSEDISDIGGGSYTLTVTDANGCTNSKTFTVNDSVPLLQIELDSLVNISCNLANDGQIAISGSGGTGPYTYQWISGTTGNDSSLTNLSAGTYQVVLTDNNSCDDTASYSITNPDALAVNKTPFDVACFGENTGAFSAIFSGGTPPYTITYSSGAGVVDSITSDGLYVSSLTSGTHSFSVTDANLCLLEDSVTITENTEINLSFSGIVQETCNDDNGSATVQVSGGVPNYSYNWSNGATTPTINMLSGGANYSVQVTDNQNCSKSDIVFVPITEAVFIKSVLVTDNICFGDSLGSLTIETSGGLFPHTFTYTHSGNSTTVVSNDTITVINNLPAGSYTLSVEDVSSCVNAWSLPITIDEDTLLSASVDAQNTTSILSCTGDNDGKIFLNISGGNPYPGNYYWLFVNSPDFSQNTTVDSVVGLSAGTYDLTIQDANGCLAEITHEIVEPLPLSTSHIVTNATCFDSSDGEVLVIVSGGTPNFSLSSTTFTNIIPLSTDTFRITALSEGTYFYDVVDSSGCQLLNNSFYIGEPSQLEIVDVTSTIESCLGYDATATVSVTGGAGGYSYFWTSDNNNSIPLVLQDGSQNPTVNAPTVQNATNGWIYIYVEDANSCFARDSVMVSQSSSPQLNLVGTVDNLCDGDTTGQISLNATGGTPFYEFSINGGGNWQFLATFSHLPSGTYSVTVRDSLGCQDVMSNINIHSPSPISVSVSTQEVSCFGDSDGSASVVTVNGGTSSNGSYNFSWQNNQGINLWPGNSSGINSTVTNLVPGTYQLEVEDDNGCTTLYFPVEIGEPLPVSVDVAVVSDYNGVDISCFGYSDAIIQANANGGTGQYFFEWYNTTDTDEIRQSISPSFDTLSLVPQDTYTVIVNDSLGCTASNSITVTHPSQIEVDFENIINIRCEGNNDGQATATYSGGLGLGNYNVVWTDSTNTIISLIAQATQLSVGTYVATYTDNNGCAGQDTININYSELFKVNNPDSITSVSCIGSIDGSFNFNVSGGWEPYTYVWNDPLAQQSPTAVGLAPGQWYTNIITDANNCILVDSVFVTSPVDEVEVTTYSVVDNDCYENTNGQITVQVSGGSPTYSYEWAGPDFTSSSQNISGLKVGTYNLVLTDNNGCEKTYSYYVDGPDAPLQINSVNTVDVSCFGLQDGSANLVGQISGGTPIGEEPFYFVNWLNENPETLSAGTYSVEVSDSAGCQTSVTFSILVPEALSMTVDVIDEYCKGQDGQIQAHVSGGIPNNTGFYQYNIEATSSISPFFNYQLSPPGSANITVQFPDNNNDADTLFLLTVTDDNGCQISQTVEIHPARLFYSNETLEVCSSDTLIISANRFADYETYLWSINPAQPFIDNGSDIEIIVNNSTTVTLTAYDLSSACSFTDELEIVELRPSIELDNTDVGIIFGESVNLSITNGEEPYLWSTGENTSSINVNPLLTTNYVAYALDTSTQCIGNDTVRVFVGMNEGFSPNADGYNDTWKIDYLNQYESLQIEVFNRWGASLWKAESPNIVNWDGNHNGKELPVGTYYYIITFSESSNNEPLTGPITIVR